jgi:drug/metabolite transporter (DMT)-like permease
MRLAGSSATTAALLRCGLALPFLLVAAGRERRRGVEPLSPRTRWMARLAGMFLAADLVVWSHAISAVGAGLATVLANLQVVLVALLAWWILGERPRRSLVVAIAVILVGVVGVAGIVGSHAYGAHPLAGVAFGLTASALYSGYLLLLRHGTGPAVVAGARRPVVAPLYEATLGGAVTAAVLTLAMGDFHLGHGWVSVGWLFLLAVSSQVVGWLLITFAMPSLAAGVVSALLLVQPVGAIGLGALVLGERPSITQLLGVAVVLAGVMLAARGEGRAVASTRAVVEREEPSSPDQGVDPRPLTEAA